MKKIIPAILIVLSCYTYGQSNYDGINQEIDGFVKSKMEELKIPGLAIAVVKDGEILKKSTYGLGNIEWNYKLSDHSNFQIASCTKLLTSTLLLKTIYKKKIDLNQSISKYLDSIPKEWEKIKIKNLISHSSGIPDFPETYSYYVSTEEAFQKLKTLPLIYEPGTKSQYGQSEFMVLSYILEKIYQKPFIQIIQDEVTKPLGMTDGAYDMEYKVANSPLGVGGYMQTGLVNEKVSTYYDNNGQLLVYKFLYPQYGYAAAAYFASISDFANWAVGLDKNILFPLDFADSLIYNHDKIDGKNAAFSKVGWIVEKEGETLYGGHSGGPGLGDVLRFPKEKLTVITLSNDGELLPGMSLIIASWYIKGLNQSFEIGKFDR